MLMDCSLEATACCWNRSGRDEARKLRGMGESEIQPDDH
jgi:hypothetical protein